MWQSVYDNPFDKMDRLAVDGGWLYRNRFVISASAQDPAHYVWAVTMAFVPEPAPAPLAAHHGKHE